MVYTGVARVWAVSNSTPHDDSNLIQQAQLNWDEAGQPVSSMFGDVYFSRANGLQETRHVFLQHNQLTERWKALSPADNFVIAETGFGSGLNFLAAWDLWSTTAPSSAQLHFISVEKFPLSKEDLTRALALWPELHSLATQLIDSYPCIVGEGFHRLRFMEGRVQLTLIINDAACGFQQLLASPDPLFSSHSPVVNAWFLDGFAPAKNPQMWSEALFSCIHMLSNTGTTAATFSAAAIVKKGLKFAGFEIQKVPGFGRKRDMLKAMMTYGKRDYFYPQPFYKSYAPFPLPWPINSNHISYATKHALIIGAGLAGCTSARSLAERGWKVTVIERSHQIAAEASGNPQGVLYAKLSPKEEAQAAFNLASLQFSQSFYAQRWVDIGEKTGVLQLADCEAEKILQTQLREKFSNANTLVEFVNAEEASVIAGVPLHHEALYFANAGWINPAKLCATLVNHPLINVITGLNVQDIQYTDKSWHINNTPELHAPVLIIANARDASAFTQTKHLPMKSIRGQVTYLPETTSSQHIKTVICSEGYIAPAQHGVHCAGATFNLKEETREVLARDHLANLENLRAPLQNIVGEWNGIDIDSLKGRVAFRCTLPDYLPAVGPVANENEMLAAFAPLRKNARAFIQQPGKYIQGLYVNLGHGSRGLAYTPLCAEVLAAHINNEPQPIANELVTALNPARFLIRDLIKNKR